LPQCKQKRDSGGMSFPQREQFGLGSVMERLDDRENLCRSAAEAQKRAQRGAAELFEADGRRTL
jgi:hypothetical protein